MWRKNPQITDFYSKNFPSALDNKKKQAILRNTIKQMLFGVADKDADVAELADAHGSGPCAARLKGSTPFVGTIKYVAGMA